MCAEHGANASCVATLTPGHGWCIEEDRKIGRYRKWYFQHNLQKTVRYIIKHTIHICTYYSNHRYITCVTCILHVNHFSYISSTYRMTTWGAVLPCPAMFACAAPWLHVCNRQTLSWVKNAQFGTKSNGRTNRSTCWIRKKDTLSSERIRRFPYLPSRYGNGLLRLLSYANLVELVTSCHYRRNPSNKIYIVIDF